MKDLLDSDGESGMQGDGDTLSINEDYKRKYDERKRKEALSRAKELLKREGQGNEGLSESESESSEEDEDSDADLLDFKTQDKILETLDRIKRRDPSIYDRSHVIFPESESEDDSEVESGKSGSLREKKPMTFRDYERRVLLESEEGGDDDVSKVTKRGQSKKLGYDKEQDELKQAFLKAAEGLEDSGDESSATLVKKDKTREELEEEERTFRSFLTRNIEEGGDPIESLNRYWGPEEDLDENERFLRNYILNQEWKECNSKTRINDEASSSYAIQTELDEEDEKHIEMSNEFESVYNFRYEEPGSGQQIMSYSRNISSLRKPDDRRKQKRKERRERKAEERLRMEEELKLLKSWKRKEIIEKLKKIQEVSGNSRISDEGLDLEAEFDPEKHDKYMEELFDEKYEEEKESLSLSEMLENINEDEGKQPDEDISLKRETKPKVEESVDDDEEWWQCDGCMKEILPNKKKFDCTVCENYTLCKSCCRNTDHEHPLEKSRVPESKSRDQGLNESDIEEMESNNRLNLSYGEDEKINSLLDEYYGLHFEDVLDNGKMPVRFKYTRVEKNDYGLSVEDILSMNDKELNQHISLKKLAPYRIDKKRKYTQPARFSREAKSPNKMSKKHQNKGHSKHARSNDKSNSSLAHINKHRLESYY
ncbi:zz domain-containing protein [Cryptosporidium canis]|uniref:Zz domain-containing protein n=1 Tax=Cryptosporidium canis TaxID=195482 RepID=A0A9D5HUX3_9CRYT|nr:zz domain-containing protein [Cryptosporidium canis]